MRGFVILIISNFCLIMHALLCQLALAEYLVLLRMSNATPITPLTHTQGLSQIAVTAINEILYLLQYLAKWPIDALPVSFL